MTSGSKPRKCVCTFFFNCQCFRTLVLHNGWFPPPLNKGGSIFTAVLAWVYYQLSKPSNGLEKGDFTTLAFWHYNMPEQLGSTRAATEILLCKAEVITLRPRAWDLITLAIEAWKATNVISGHYITWLGFQRLSLMFASDIAHGCKLYKSGGCVFTGMHILWKSLCIFCPSAVKSEAAPKNSNGEENLGMKSVWVLACSDCLLNSAHYSLLFCHVQALSFHI